MHVQDILQVRLITSKHTLTIQHGHANNPIRWPVIVGIIVGSLIVLSILYCLAKILCFGAECCFCCLSCCSCCRGSRSRNKGGYQQQPPPQPYQQPYQYASAQPPMYAAPAQQYAHFEAPSGAKGYRQNGDALPAMPSWDTAASRRIPNHNLPDDDMELGKMDAANEPMLPKVDSPATTHAYPYQSNVGGQYGDLGAVNTAYGQQSPYDNHGQSYGNSGAYGLQQQPIGYSHGYGNQTRDSYAPSVPPSYHTTAVGERKPVTGSWRDL